MSPCCSGCSGAARRPPGGPGRRRLSSAWERAASSAIPRARAAATFVAKWRRTRCFGQKRSSSGSLVLSLLFRFDTCVSAADDCSVSNPTIDVRGKVAAVKSFLVRALVSTVVCFLDIAGQRFSALPPIEYLCRVIVRKTLRLGTLSASRDAYYRQKWACCKPCAAFDFSCSANA